MRILFVQEVDWKNKVVYEIHDFPELMSLRGHDVSLLDFPEDRMSLFSRASISQQSRAWSGSEIRLVSPTVLLGPVLGRWILAAVAPFLLWRLMHRLRPQVVVTYAVPTLGWQAAMIGRFLGIPVMYRAIDASAELRPGLHKPLVRLAERIVCKWSSHVSTHNEALRDRCIALGAKSASTSLLLPGVDKSRFHPGPVDSQLREELGLDENDAVILFMGTLFHFAQLDTVVRLLAPHLRDNPSLKFVIIGTGEAAETIRNVIIEEKLGDSVRLTGLIQLERLPDYLRLGDLGILPFVPSPVTHCALPNKVLQYLSCGLPTVAIWLRGLASIVPNKMGVEYVTDVQELSNQVVAIVQDKSRLQEMRAAAIRFSEQNLDWTEKIEKFEHLSLQLVHER